MMNNVYSTVVQGAPYEIRFDFTDEVNDEQVENYRQQFLADEDGRIADAQIMYGDGRTVTETSSAGVGINTYKLGDLEASVGINETETVGLNTAVRIFSNVTQFLSGAIGNRFKETVMGEKDLANVDRGIWVDAGFAETTRIQVGTVIDSIDVFISVSNRENPLEPDTQIRGPNLSNVTVAGIVNLETGASAGMFSGVFSSASEIFLPATLFVNETEFLQDLAEKEMRYCVLKIDESKFPLADLAAVNTQIEKLINGFERDDNTLEGSNLVQDKLIPFQIMNMFIIIFDFILTLPVVILSIYLLSFGIDLALEERRYQVGVLKTQGASGKQIKSKIVGETFLLAAVGIVIGYVLALIMSWGIGTARGYMKFDWEYAISQLGDFLILDMNLIFMVGLIILLILYIMINGKSNNFIEMEISETVRRADEERKDNWLKRNHLDIGFFVVGLLTLLVLFLQIGGIVIDLGPIGPLIAITGPFLFWIGGAACVARLAIWIPTKTDRFVKRVNFLKDVNVLVKANVFRKSSEVPRLAIIIALTVSFAVLAAVQGTTGEIHQERLIDWTTGSDFRVSTVPGRASLMIPAIKNNSDPILKNVDKVMAMTTTTSKITGDFVVAHSIDAQEFKVAAIWQSDNFPGNNREELLTKMANDRTRGCLIGEGLLVQQDLKVGEDVLVEFMTYKIINFTVINGNPSIDFETVFIEKTVEILGTFSHLPGGISNNGLIVDHQLITSLYQGLEILAGMGIDLNDSLFASEYLVKAKNGATFEELTAIKDQLLDRQLFPGVSSVTSLAEEIRKSNELQNADYGVPGLLTMDFVVSLLASTLASYVFMSILMEKRKKEFAIMRSYGASRGQVYKVVFSETIVFLLTAIIWGLLIGIGLAYLFNGFFEFMDIFVAPFSVVASGGTVLPRLLTFDPVMLLVTLGLSFVTMLLATYLSVRGAVKANISTVVRQL
jgi:ABC-type antimicrobial peptide transport system permease subunit